MKTSGRSFSSEELAPLAGKVWQALTDPAHLRGVAPFDRRWESLVRLETT